MTRCLYACSAFPMCGCDNLVSLYPPTLEQRDALAAAVFPDEWNRVVNLTGKQASKRRQKLRKAAEIEVHIMRPLRARGASCASCANYDRYPHGEGHHCAALSDFHGYVSTQPTFLCDRWRARP